LLLGVVPVALALVASLVLIASTSGWLRWTAVGVAVVAGYLVGLTMCLVFRPRLAYGSRQLLAYLRPGPPIQIPIEIVECFFLGQGPSLLSNPLSADDDSEEASTIVVRLAEAADDWKHREVKSSLGLWCDGYITIRGTWCEPIDGKLLERLNRLLVEAHRETKTGRNRTEQEAG
jgi:hypothetical protein